LLTPFACPRLAATRTPGRESRRPENAGPPASSRT
jgi:hypothetical protein